MATLYVNTDDQSNGEYASLALAEAALPSTLTEPYVIECSGTTTDTTKVTISGPVTTETNNITLKGNGYDGSYQLIPTTAHAIEVDVSNISIQDIYFSLNKNATYSSVLDIGNSFTNVIVERCHIHTLNTRAASYNILVGSTPAIVRNTLITCESETDGTGIRQTGSGSATYNVTVAGGFNYGVYLNWTSNDTYNVIAVDSETDFYLYGGTQEGDNYIDSDGTASAIVPTTYTSTAAALFTDPDNGDYTLKSGSLAIGTGLDLSSLFTDDIDGITRSTWDIGTFAYSAGSGSEIELILADATHAASADSLALQQIHNLTTASATHGHLADQLSLLQQHVLSLSDSGHDHTAGTLILLQEQLLAIIAAAHVHSADGLALTQQHNLSVAGADHAHSVAGLSLTQNHNLAVAGATHGQSADPLTLLLGELLLAVQSATHSHSVDGLTLGQQRNLSVVDAQHGHIAAALTLEQQHQLAIADALHAHRADGISLDLSLVLAIADAIHAQGTDSIELIQDHILQPADSFHGHLADQLDLLQAHNLTVEDALHSHTAGSLTLYIHGLGLGIISDTTVLQLTPQRGKLTLTVERSVKKV
jgi:hypothetical protein